MKELEKVLIVNFKSVRAFRTLSDLKSNIQEELISIGQERKKSSCPGFSNPELRGGGCNAMSTFKNQHINLTHLCDPLHTTPVNVETLEPLLAIQCQPRGINNQLAWSIDPSLLTCAKNCFAFDNGTTYNTKIGHRRELLPRKGYRWTNSTANIITSVKCIATNLTESLIVGIEEDFDLSDVDECSEQPKHKTCPMTNGVCKNVPGSYLCVCDDGYSPFNNENCTYGKLFHILNTSSICHL